MRFPPSGRRLGRGSKGCKKAFFQMGEGEKDKLFENPFNLEVLAQKTYFFNLERPCLWFEFHVTGKIRKHSRK